MKAIAQSVYGSADVLSLREVPDPVAGAGEVLVQVRAAGVDPGVWVCMTGQPYAARAAFGLTRPKVAVRGRALAGVVVSVGAGVTAFQAGDEVYGTTASGTYAEFAAVPVRFLAHKPASLSFTQAAAVPISAVTAVVGLRDVAKVVPGQRVMVIGAAGGVGAYAVQIAVALGAVVTGVCGPGKDDLVRSLGADDVIDYTSAEVDRDGAVYDVVLDTAGCRPLALLCRAVVPRGLVVLAGGGHDAGGLLGGFTRAMRAPFVSLVAGRRVRGLISGERAELLDDLTRLIEDGKVKPVIDRVYPLAEAPDAIRYLAQGHPAGKVVVTI
ncbi:NADPH:quinone reductase [Asanoa ishikariensis]|uniref:NADPH:quinone reductase n=1 Tax=Asanoa ishikariensis TaxID=137265 RepID=A0A1H3TZ75_9ACTN|nr:NAD(P)-dependent alcohol dehydrogenase [Asanoa ishikariensis]GIF67742.1 NADPH:quinone reductase [Asanoa ishikariensis]SDZ55510.1 NADPH:quinone reductase [Asanoa ishikariensis]